MSPLAQQPAQNGVADVVGHLAAQPGQRAADAVAQRRRGSEQDLEEVEHHREEDDRSPERVQQHPVDSLRALIWLRGNVIGCVEDGLTPCVDVVLAGWRQHRRALPLRERRQLRSHIVDSRSVVRHDRGHRDAQRRGQSRGVDAATAGSQLVAHGQRQQARQVQPQHLTDQQDRPAQCGGIGDQDNRVGRVDTRALAGQQVRHHLLVRADRVEAVGAGQVLDGNRNAVHFGGADAASHGDARVVSGFGA